MATVDVLVAALVTKTSDPAGFQWQYSKDGGPRQSGSFEVAKINHGDTLKVTMIISAAVAGGQCVFQSAPLRFVRPTTPPIDFTPEWYQPTLGEDNSLLNFTDTNDNIDNQTYHFFIDAIYTEGTSAAPQSIESPDPTIVNVGTDQPPSEWPSRVRPATADAAV